jgi:RsiW-degrading membrane proteinase PrsW (M82 family)
MNEPKEKRISKTDVFVYLMLALSMMIIGRILYRDFGEPEEVKLSSAISGILIQMVCLLNATRSRTISYHCVISLVLFWSFVAIFLSIT